MLFLTFWFLDRALQWKGLGRWLPALEAVGAVVALTQRGVGRSLSGPLFVEVELGGLLTSGGGGRQVISTGVLGSGRGGGGGTVFVGAGVG